MTGEPLPGVLVGHAGFARPIFSTSLAMRTILSRLDKNRTYTSQRYDYVPGSAPHDAPRTTPGAHLSQARRLLPHPAILGFAGDAAVAGWVCSTSVTPSQRCRVAASGSARGRRRRALSRRHQQCPRSACSRGRRASPCDGAHLWPGYCCTGRTRGTFRAAVGLAPRGPGPTEPRRAAGRTQRPRALSAGYASGVRFRRHDEGRRGGRGSHDASCNTHCERAAHPRRRHNGSPTSPRPRRPPWPATARVPRARPCRQRSRSADDRPQRYWRGPRRGAQAPPATAPVT